jgi:hypothetical protein
MQIGLNLRTQHIFSIQTGLIEPWLLLAPTIARTQSDVFQGGTN